MWWTESFPDLWIAESLREPFPKLWGKKIPLELSLQEQLWQRITNTFNLTKNKDRVMLWKTAFMSAKDHFWLGIGIQNDEEALAKYRRFLTDEYRYYFATPISHSVHNIYLQILVINGIIGLISYLLIWLIFYQKSIVSLRNGANTLEYYLLWGCISGITAFLFVGIFLHNFLIAEIQTMAFIILGIALYSIESLQKN